MKLIERSAWWGSAEIGAFAYLGEFRKREAVLKIQGVKTETAEAEMITGFARTNRSKVLRPPHLLDSLPWDNEQRYEALVMEYVDGKRVVKTPTTSQELEEFFSLFKDYRKNCRSNPWLEKPNKTLSEQVFENFQTWKKISRKIYPSHPLRDRADEGLIDQTVDLLTSEYSQVASEFQHAHLSEADLVRVDEEVVVLSNLYWLWRAPFYDAVFGYHWFMYHLNDVYGITSGEVESQRGLWLGTIIDLAKTDEEKRLLNLALLERAAAGLNLDALSTDPEIPISKYLVKATREQIKSLTRELH